MRHKLIYTLILLSASVTYFSSCTSDDTPLTSADNYSDLITPTIIDSIETDSLNEATLLDDWETVELLDSAEFAEQMKHRIIKAPDRSKSRIGTVEIRHINNYYKVTLSLRGFSMIYETPVKDKFIPDIKDYQVRYERADNEYPGKAYGHVYSDSEMYIMQDFTRRVAPQIYEYAYSVGIQAKILNGEFILAPIGDLYETRY